MEWQSTLTRLIGVTMPIGEALRAGVVKDAAAAFVHPSLCAARDALLAELQQHTTHSELLKISATLRQQHEALALKSELSVVELQRLGVLSGLALALSAKVLAQTLSEQDIFFHAVTQIGPWLGRAVDCGLVSMAKPVQALKTVAEEALNKTASALCPEKGKIP